VRLIEPASIEISDLRTYDEGWYECSVVMLDERTGEQATNNGSWVHLTVNGTVPVLAVLPPGRPFCCFVLYSCRIRGRFKGEVGIENGCVPYCNVE